MKLIDCPYPCNPSCYNLNFTWTCLIAGIDQPPLLLDFSSSFIIWGVAILESSIQLSPKGYHVLEAWRYLENVTCFVLFFSWLITEGRLYKSSTIHNPYWHIAYVYIIVIVIYWNEVGFCVERSSSVMLMGERRVNLNRLNVAEPSKWWNVRSENILWKLHSSAVYLTGSLMFVHKKIWLILGVNRNIRRNIFIKRLDMVKIKPSVNFHTCIDLSVAGLQRRSMYMKGPFKTRL